ncbi:MAG: type II 3-dehydroquinate dehydratase [Fusobacteriaceae bacterium]
MKVLLINGPNLNFLGIREPEIYGKETLKDIEEKLKKYSEELEIDLATYQSNHEGDIIDKIQETYEKKIDYLVINPGAYTHYSIGIRDAIKAVGIKTIEVHLSNVHTREEFRKKSMISDIALGTIGGFGSYGYFMALDYIKNRK